MSAQLQKQQQDLEARKAALTGKKGASSSVSGSVAPGSTGNVAAVKKKFALFT
jgi:hypothetical protein